MGEHHALRRAGRARSEDELQHVRRFGARPGVDLGSQSAGKVSSGSATRSSSRDVGEPVETRLARIGRVAAGAQDQALWPRLVARSARSRRAPFGGRAARRRCRPASHRSRPPAGPASRATRSGRDRPAPGPPRADAMPRVDCAAGAPDTTSARPTHRRRRAPAPVGRRSVRRRRRTARGSLSAWPDGSREGFDPLRGLGYAPPALNAP